MKATQSSFQHVSKTQEYMVKTQRVINQLSRQMASQASSSGEFIGNTMRNRVVPSEPKGTYEKKESGEVQKKSGKKVVVENELDKNSDGKKVRIIVIWS